VTEIAKESGGRHFLVQIGSQMIAMAEQIGEQLRNQYVLGYSSSNKTRDGKYRPLRIELHETKGMGCLRIHARQGYHVTAAIARIIRPDATVRPVFDRRGNRRPSRANRYWLDGFKIHLCITSHR